ncbi:MAG: aldehyde dehydrogenase family protein [Gemmatimonadetes bacterium]|nr:aldehyde dehydrogenase family protein [Gemmatimonadota bacterium]
MDGQTIFIDGNWRPARDERTIPVVNPSTGVTFGALARGTAADIDDAVAAARRSFTARWSRTSPVERGRMLTRLGELILRDHEEIALLECRDVGKPIGQARRDITACARYCEFYGGAADKLHGETLPYEPGYTVMAVREPFGVTAHIIPWNYPAQMFGRSAIAALAAGNAIVVKPGEDACLSILAIVDRAMEAGLPPGVLNVVTGYGSEAGAALAGHPGVDHISFTGSPATGTLVQQAAAVHNRPATMELGGKSPQIVFADADLDEALPLLYGALVQNAGQTCSAGSRILIERSRFDEVVERLSQRFAATRVGPAEDDPDCGPLISAKQAARVQAFVDKAEAEDFRVAAVASPVAAASQVAAASPADGGSSAAARPSGEGGFYVRPRLYAPVQPDHELSREEIFGPVLVATPFDDEDHAVRLANATEYGLVAGLWTENGGRQLRVAHALDVGQVFVNCYGAGGGVELPFGGVKRSGYGREKGMEGLESFTRTKMVALRHG